MARKTHNIPDKITHPKKRAFLAAFRDVGIITPACRSIGMDSSTVYWWRDHDPLFAREFEIARRQAGDSLCAHAINLARRGVRKYVLYKGEPVKIKLKGSAAAEPLVETDYPIALLIFLLKHYGMDEHGLRAPGDTGNTSAEGISQEDMIESAIKSMVGKNEDVNGDDTTSERSAEAATECQGDDTGVV